MRIVTHNGKIHSDEVSAIALLSSYFNNKGVEVSVLRTRNSDIFLDNDYLVDVGGEYNHSKHKYDHHQPDFNEFWRDSEIPLSSAGLIWRHYGKEIVEMYLTNNSEQYDEGLNYSETTIEELVNLIYQKLIIVIDANDNGISLPEQNLNISDIVSAVNSKNVNDDTIQNTNFHRAVSLIGNIFDIKFREIISGYFDFQKDLEIVSSFNIFEKEYLILEKNIPTIFKCLEKLDTDNHIKFCIFYDENKNEYTIKARRLRGEKYLPICPIYISNIMIPEDVIFVHKELFIAKTKTLFTAEEIVQRSLEYNKIPNLEIGEEIEEIKEIKEVQNVIKKVKINKNILLGGVAAIGGMAALSYLYLKKND